MTKPGTLQSLISLLRDTVDAASDTVAASFVVGQDYEEIKLKPTYPQVFMELPTQSTVTADKMDFRFALNLVNKYAQDQSDLETVAASVHAGLWEYLLRVRTRAHTYQFAISYAESQLFLLRYLPGNTLGYRVELRAITGAPTPVDYPWSGS